MGDRRPQLARFLGITLLLTLGILLASCSGSDQNTLAPGGDVAQKQKDLFLLALWPAIAILIVVQGTLVYALIRYRRRQGQELPTQVHGNTRMEIAWTIAPAILLIILSVPMVAGVIDLAREPRTNAYGEPLQVTVTGFQWNWQFEYPEFTDSEGNPLRIIGTCPTNCAEMHIPLGREIGVALESVDVNHSFWVPKLAGKLDAIPGRTGRMWFNATEPGVYPGQCAEFCGLGHSDMRFTIVAESEAEFQAWVAEQLGEDQAAESGASTRY